MVRSFSGGLLVAALLYSMSWDLLTQLCVLLIEGFSLCSGDVKEGGVVDIVVDVSILFVVVRK